MLRTALFPLGLARRGHAFFIQHMDTVAGLHQFAFVVAERFVGVKADAPGPAVFVVHRHPDMAAQRVVTKRRDQGEPGKDPLRNPPVITVGLAVASAVERQPKRVLLDVEDDVAVGLDVVQRLDALVHRVDIHLVAVHVRHVRGVDAAFHGLQVVALLQPTRDKDVAVGQGAPLQRRWFGLVTGRAHVGPHDAAALNTRVGLDAHALGYLWRTGHIDTGTGAVELEAVVGAADAAFLVAAEIQRHATVRAELVDQPRIAIGIAKGQQLLAHDLHPHLRSVGLGDLRRAENRHPVAAQ